MWDALWRIALRAALRAAYRVLRVYWRVRRPDVHGAYVAVWQDQRLLLIRNSYRAGETVPCGGIRRGESPARAAARELSEEVGIDAAEQDLRFVAVCVVDFEDKTDHAHFFELRVGPEAKFRTDEREVIWADFVPLAELPGRPLLPHVSAYLERVRSQSAS